MADPVAPYNPHTWYYHYLKEKNLKILDHFYLLRLAVPLLSRVS